MIILLVEKIKNSGLEIYDKVAQNFLSLFVLFLQNYEINHFYALAYIAHPVKKTL